MSPKLIKKKNLEKKIKLKFPSDLVQKSKEMAELYYNLFIFENFFRLFIEDVAKNKFGSNFLKRLNINKKIQEKINERKEEEKSKKWLSIRGDSDLFYTDLVELKTIISSNWEMFKEYFHKESWITSKLEDLYDLRNKIAHNSYLDETEQKTVESIIGNIYAQLKATLRYEKLGLEKKDKKYLKKRKKKLNSKSEEHFEDNLISEISTLMSDIRLLIKNEPPDYIVKIHNKMDKLLLKAKSLIDKRQRKALGIAYILFNNALQVKPPMKRTLQTLFDLINIIILGR